MKRKTRHSSLKSHTLNATDYLAGEDSPQAPPFATVDLTSTVTAGNVPMVTVKMKHTDRAITQIWQTRQSLLSDQLRWVLYTCRHYWVIKYHKRKHFNPKLRLRGYLGIYCVYICFCQRKSFHLFENAKHRHAGFGLILHRILRPFLLCWIFWGRKNIIDHNIGQGSDICSPAIIRTEKLKQTFSCLGELWCFAPLDVKA